MSLVLAADSSYMVITEYYLPISTLPLSNIQVSCTPNGIHDRPNLVPGPTDIHMRIEVKFGGKQC